MHDLTIWEEASYGDSIKVQRGSAPGEDYFVGFAIAPPPTTPRDTARAKRPGRVFLSCVWIPVSRLARPVPVRDIPVGGFPRTTGEIGIAQRVQDRQLLC